MGFYAGSLGGDDSAPAADTKTPPNKVKTGVLTGTVKDIATGQPVGGVPVTLAFQGQGVANPTAITAADGTYAIGPVPTGHYGKLTVNGAGYVPISRDVTVAASGSASDFSVVRDWVAVSGGATIVAFDGPDYSDFGCGPAQALDLSLATGWGSTTGNSKGTPTNVFVPKHLTVDMKRKVNITSFAVDPSATCGDAGSASTGQYQIETSPDNVTWTVAASGTFTVADRGRLNTVTPTQASLGVQYVRFTILGNQVPDFATNCPNGGVRRLHLHRPDRAPGLRGRHSLSERPTAGPQHGGRPSASALRARRRSARAARRRGRRRRRDPRRERHPRRPAAAVHALAHPHVARLAEGGQVLGEHGVADLEPVAHHGELRLADRGQHGHQLQPGRGLEVRVEVGHQRSRTRSTSPATASPTARASQRADSPAPRRAGSWR